jgi:hypothetical protein
MRDAARSEAWILDQTEAEYNTALLISGERVPELWTQEGTIYVYLHPKDSGLGPSFKLPSFVVDNSIGFRALIAAELASPSAAGRPRARSFANRGSLSVTDAEPHLMQPPSSPPPGASWLFIPTTPQSTTQARGSTSPELERLVTVRNLFAFLTGQPLVGTKAAPNLFRALMGVAALLAEFEFSNADGSTFGDAVEMSFGFCADETGLADVRLSREKTLESLVLGERMRSWDLYNESFAHAVGKYAAILDLGSPLWDQVSPMTRQKLERAHLELLNRQDSVNNRLEAFEFPALFSGVANSTTLWDKSMLSRMSTWRKSFNRMKQLVLGHYKSKFGSWPPKARSKKNPFSESGLNRQVLKILYSDLCALYDLIADRESLTSRVIDDTAEDIQPEGQEPYISALRMILSEYDHSSPPVLPPIPFDMPRLPDMTSVKENFYEQSTKQQAKLEKNIQDYEMMLILNKAYDFETFKLELPFLEDFKDFEQKEAKGKSVSDMADQRIGYWLFLYVVIQCLPMLVVDAPGLKYTEGVEYFLCQAPKGNPPWLADGPEGRRRWYEVSGGAGYVQLSEDVVEFSIEGIYNRSHCWAVAKQWEQNPGQPTSLSQIDEPLSPLPAPPQAAFGDMAADLPTNRQRSQSPASRVSPQLAFRPRGSSPVHKQGRRSSIAFGLEPVDLPFDGYPSEKRSSRVFNGRDISNGNLKPPILTRNRSKSSGDIKSQILNKSPPNPAETQITQPSVGSTFDDILKDMENAPKKRRSIFFG